jgi:hypothetical protein
VSTVWQVYWRAEDQRLWTADGQAFEAQAGADLHADRLKGRPRGRHTVAETLVLEYPSARDVRAFVPVGKEKEAAPAEASSELRPVPELAKALATKTKTAKG